MNEGLANVAGSKLAKEDIHKNDAKMTALFAAKALLSLDELNDTARFNDAVERMLSAKKVEAGKDAASAAAEASPAGGSVPTSRDRGHALDHRPTSRHARRRA